jgi:threonine/homoserine/homoserine lactone efflux protein
VAVLSGEALLFLAVLTLIPGPDTFLALRQGLAGGLRAALPAIAGIQCGLLVHASVVGLGLALLLRESPGAYRVVQFAGVGYLAFLGIRSLLAARRVATTPLPPPSGASSFRDGVLNNVLNPKVALFYLGFLPQFIHEGQPYFLTAVLYGLVHALMGETQLSAVAAAADAVRMRVTSPRFRQGAEIVAGVAFLGFSLRLALSG